MAWRLRVMAQGSEEISALVVNRGEKWKGQPRAWGRERERIAKRWKGNRERERESRSWPSTTDGGREQ